jgi:phthalate 4,5-dioxygenase oxygenase subunit
MLSAEENELLTRVGPGTPMGDVLRRYWIPALLADELPEPDCPPVRVRLLGEGLVAFRDTQGRVGLVDEFCPHRRGPLFFGRNEGGGLRCIFHGWKFDVLGRCLEQPNEKPELRFEDKVRLKAYPTVELGDVIWAYMGPAERVPPEPKFEYTQVPKTHRQLRRVWEECNWLQALEGGIDHAHVSFLHTGMAWKVDPTLSVDDPNYYRGKYPTLDIEVEFTDFGLHYVGFRHVQEIGTHVRADQYVMPFTQIRAAQHKPASPATGGKPKWTTNVAGHHWVPIDDENCMVYNWEYSYGDDPLPPEEKIVSADVDPRSFKKTANKENDYLIDREAQKTRSWTGIAGINAEDHAIQEGMGPIVDRTKENLASTDSPVVGVRRLLLDAAETVRGGGDPPGIGPSYYRLRAREGFLKNPANWRNELLPSVDEPSPAGR